MKFEDCKDYNKCEDGFYRYVYVTICTNPNYKDNFYIGKHKHKHILNNYTGSGKLIKQYIKEYPDEYIKLILGTYLNNEEQSKAELYFINKYINDYTCLNINKVSAAGFSNHNHSEKTKKLFRLRKHSEEWKQNQSNKMCEKNNPFYGKHHSKEWCENHSKKMKGKKHSPEEYEKQSKTFKSKKYKWLTDNIVEVRVSSEYWGEFIDIGFHFGRIYFSRKRKK